MLETLDPEQYLQDAGSERPIARQAKVDGNSAVLCQPRQAVGSWLAHRSLVKIVFSSSKATSCVVSQSPTHKRVGLTSSALHIIKSKDCTSGYAVQLLEQPQNAAAMLG